jgi:hypothetical protein
MPRWLHRVLLRLSRRYRDRQHLLERLRQLGE